MQTTKLQISQVQNSIYTKKSEHSRDSWHSFTLLILNGKEQTAYCLCFGISEASECVKHAVWS